MKSVIFSIILIIPYSSCVSQNFIKVSKQIAHDCEGNKRGLVSTIFHDIRSKLFNEEKIQFLNNGFDTLYLLESYEIENGVCAGLIWNNDGALNYIYYKDHFEFPNEKNYTAYTVSLIEKWDLVTIKAEEKKNTIELPQKYITGIRLINKSGNININCIRFKEFFDQKRDR